MSINKNSVWLILPTLILLNLSYLHAGTTGKLAGTIYDTNSKDPLVGANILVEARWENNKEIPLKTPTGASTDLDGSYFIINLRPGDYTVRATYVGYRDEIKTRVRVDVDKTTRLDYELSEQLLETEEIVVTAYTSETVEKDITATKQVYNISEVQSIAGVNDISDILELQADVVDDHFRGGRVGESSYLLGGATIVNPLNNERAFNPIVTGLDQVEVYTSGFSAEYGNAQSGVVNMVTREGSQVWQTRLEVAGVLPHYKTWQGSPYTQENLVFSNLLLDPEEWLKDNPQQPGKPLWDNGYGVNKYLPEPPITWPPPPPNTHEDSLRIAEFGRIMWLQSVRDIGMQYDNTVDYRLDLTTGGPLTRDIGMFIALRQNVVHPEVPTSEPDNNIQIMGNFTYSPNPNNKFKLSYLYDNAYINVIGSNWERWMFDRTFSITKRKSSSYQTGLEYLHTFSPSYFSEFSFNYLTVNESDRIDLLAEGQLFEDYQNGRNWVDYTTPSNHRVGRLNDDRGDIWTNTYYIAGSFTGQVDRHNMLKAGMQFYYYDLRVDYQENVTNPGAVEFQNFGAFPWEGAVYLQDKMEFEGMVANIGLRFDFYQLNTNYYTDPFNPLLDPDAQEATKLYTRLQPRVGFSFPVSTLTVFHLNYGTFTQRPSFNQLYFNNVNNDQGVIRVLELGNPQLKPENTKTYDLGIVHRLASGVQLDISAYYKDVKDLIQTAFFVNKGGEAYTTFVNLDYADIKGFHFSLEKNTQKLRGYIRYNYEIATGKSSNASNLDVAPIFSESGDALIEGQSERFPEDVLLDYDRSHKAVFNIRYVTSPNEGVEFLGFKPFSDMSISTTYRFVSGRPYTWDVSGQGLKFNQRSPNENDWRLRIEKSFGIGKTRLTAYVEGLNLLNEYWWQYSRTFNNDRNIVRWETLPNNNDVLVDDEYAPYMRRQDVYLLRNSPRHWRIGVILKF
jgi:outer membrane receptor protein involved in Fe transport